MFIVYWLLPSAHSRSTSFSKRGEGGLLRLAIGFNVPELYTRVGSVQECVDSRLCSNWAQAFLLSRSWKWHPICHHDIMSFPTQGKVEDYFLPLFTSTTIYNPAPFPSRSVSYFLLWCRVNLTSIMRPSDLHLWITVGPHQYSWSRPPHKLLFFLPSFLFSFFSPWFFCLLSLCTFSSRIAFICPLCVYFCTQAFNDEI